MNYGLSLASSGLLTSLYRQDVAANNLANASTVGFKRDLAMITQRDAEAIEDPRQAAFRHPLLDQLGGGAFAGPQTISFEPGPLEKSGIPLDLALESPDAFFVVRKPTGPGGQAQQEIRFTRDGRMAIREGYLVTTAGGLKVLDDADQPIQVDPASPVFIDRDGRVMQDGAAVAQIQVASPPQREQLQKDGQNLLRLTDGAAKAPAADRRVRSGFVEASGVDPIRELMTLMETSSAIQYNSNLIRYHDLLMDRAVNSLGRVVG